MTAFGEAEVISWYKVEKADGRVFYHRVKGETDTEVTEEEYLIAHTK